MKSIKIILLLMLVLAVTRCSILEYDQAEIEESIYVNQQTVDIFKGEQVQLIASPTGITYQWRSEDPAVATVSSTGLVEAVGAGSTYVLAYRDDVETRVLVNVIERILLVDIVLNVDEAVEMIIGEEITVTAVPAPADANNYDRFTWSSDDENVVIVDQSGKITTMGLGTANITVKAGNISKQISIDVIEFISPVDLVYDSSESMPVFQASNNIYLRSFNIQLEPNTTYYAETTLPANNGSAAIFVTDDTAVATKVRLLPNTPFEITTGPQGYIYVYARPPVDVDGTSFTYNYTQIENGTYKLTIRKKNE